ncbi:phosphoribosylformylglycinamidine synthase subunit PurQ [Fodinisporobacter ferrooxydans]|uniref:Phosphoribosylformylglycinamidine synthase subunit PurQ n=1 Tax=Fodinisporobacter ferrooxydans TaxID=2901836 RepID=A0ABY4CPI5_9BACL|nr:phosphoribosylformylglycinamidine synthase subunit PurQ [Alicyclobacillaceae bacterium MYW30-H2]
MKTAVVVFPGSNCDVDAVRAIEDVMGLQADMVWHSETDVSAYDFIFLPGGFSYGDYLRTGAIAQFSPIMKAIREQAEQGTYILGVCNGFQILLEAGLLPGAMRHNDHLQFRCDIVPLSVEQVDTPFTGNYQKGQIIQIPIAHGEGNYFADEETLNQLEQNNQILFRYHETNPNGSVRNIAGICNAKRNVLGMMPHPERAVHEWLGSADGRAMFQSILTAWREQHA